MSLESSPIHLKLKSPLRPSAARARSLSFPGRCTPYCPCPVLHSLFSSGLLSSGLRPGLLSRLLALRSPGRPMNSHCTPGLLQASTRMFFFPFCHV